MWRSVLVYFGILTTINGFKIKPPLGKCTNHAGSLPLGAEVAGCTNFPPPCVLTQGETVLIYIAFRASRYTLTMRTRIMTFQTIMGVVYELPVKLENNEDRTCNYLWNATCPVKKGELLLYRLEWLLHEPTFIPGETAETEIGILDDNDVMICMRIQYIIGPGKLEPFVYRTRQRISSMMQSLYNG